MRRALFIPVLLSLTLGVVPLLPASAVPIVTDSRIKTFVYNANEVFTVTTHYGYQSNIEFGEKESIDTVSVGDRVAWQIVPAGRRLFIRAMEENAHTNMTIVTNLRAYQFDLRSSSADAVFGSEELTYVVRFFYPGESDPMALPARYTPAPVAAMPAPMPMATPVSYTPPAASAPLAALPPASTGTIPAPMPVAAAPLPAPSFAPAPAPTGPMNYRYTYSGPSATAPVKIYDDGRSTFFKFRSTAAPRVAVITAKGERLDVPTRNVGGNIVAVDIVAPRFSLDQPGGQVIVYNESSGA